MMTQINPSDINNNRRAKTEGNQNHLSTSSSMTPSIQISSSFNIKPKYNHNEDKHHQQQHNNNEIKREQIQKESSIEKDSETKTINQSSTLPHHRRDDSKNVLYSKFEQNEIQNAYAVPKQLPTKPTKKEINCEYCMECLIETPLRAKHCKICNRCINTFDHHCKWIANCIGENNKWIFHLFLLYMSILLAFGIIYDVFFGFEIKDNERNEIGKFFEDNWLVLINSMLLVLVFSFVFSLFVFQIQIAMVNQSTWERYTWHKLEYMIILSGTDKSPFDLGWKKNIDVVYNRKKYLKNNEEVINWKEMFNL